MRMLRAVVWIGLVATTLGLSANTGVERTDTFCDGTTLSLTCATAGDHIHVVTASYGRTDATVCADATVTGTEYSCSSDSSSLLAGLVNGHNNYNFPAGTNFLGLFGDDACPGVKKYVTLTWTCNAPVFTGPGSANFCERDDVVTWQSDVNIECGAGEVINVVSASYGRASATICPYSQAHDNSQTCTGGASEIVIKLLCNGQNSCQFAPTTDFFEIDPCPGTYKYVNVYFTCVTPVTTGAATTNELRVDNFCADASFDLTCANPEDIIQVYSAQYGRKDSTICADSSVTPGANYNCVSTHSSKMAGLVNERVGSFSWPNGETYANLIGANPCGSVSSYMRIVWMCKTSRAVDPRARTFDPNPPTCRYMGPGAKVFCERNGRTQWKPDVSICCPPGQDILIYKAFYGRAPPVKNCCPYAWSHLNKQDCIAAQSQEKIEGACNGENSCTFPPTNGFFGDPCYGTYKMVYVEFTCITYVPELPAPRYHPQRGCYCYGMDFQLSCQNPNDVIKVHGARYGRYSSDVCYDTSVPSSDYTCYHPNSNYMRGLISGRNSYSWTGDFADFFGPYDGCDGDYPYLCLRWCCVPLCLRPAPGWTFAFGFFCERNTITVWKPDVELCCPAGKVIKIHHGFYGRFISDPHICPYHLEHLNVNTCSEPTAEWRIKQQCDGLNTCSFPPTNGWFGNDPCYNTYKYVFVKFCCEDPPPTPTPPPEEYPCYCTIECDPKIKGFDNEALFIDVGSGEVCKAVDTLNELNNLNICRYLIEVIFGANSYPSGMIIIIKVPGDPTFYNFHLPPQLTDNPPPFVDIQVTEDGATATSAEDGCKFELSIEFGLMPKVTICMMGGDENMIGCHGGLCGNCNNVFDDYVLRNGTRVDTLTNKFALMRDSYCYTPVK